MEFSNFLKIDSFNSQSNLDDSDTRLQRFILRCFLDQSVDEIYFNGSSVIFERRGQRVTQIAGICDCNLEFAEMLIEFAANHQVRLDPLVGFAGGEIVELPGRWHSVLPPLSCDGPILCVRRHKFDSLSIGSFDLPTNIKRDLLGHFEEGHPLLIIGPTGSGKTSLLSCLLQEMAIEKRVIIIEVIPELMRLGKNWVRLRERVANRAGSGAISSSDLLTEALRLNPDRLVFGEIRSSEARSFVEAARTGHTGAIATMHAGTSEEALSRLRELSGGLAPPNNLGILKLIRGEPPKVLDFTCH